MAEATTFVYNAEDKVLGRLASVVAKQLITAKKAGEDTRVIIVNAEKIIVTGNKAEDKLYRRHSGRPGGMKIESYKELQARIPERIPAARICPPAALSRATRADGGGAELGGVDARERPLERADRGAGGADDEALASHGDLLCGGASAPRRSARRGALIPVANAGAGARPGCRGSVTRGEGVSNGGAR